MKLDELEDVDRKIISRLWYGESEEELRKRPSQISKEIEDVSRPWISKRLKALEEKDLVTVENVGRERYYKMVTDYRDEMEKISAKVEDSQFINQTPVNQMSLYEDQDEDEDENGKISVYGLPDGAEESLESADINFLQERVKKMYDHVEEQHEEKISDSYDEKVEHVGESIQRYVEDSKASFMRIVWHDTEYSKGYLRRSDEIVDTEYVIKKEFRGLNKTEGLEQFISELLQEVRRRKRLKIVAGN